jgi:hypothetical protein
MKLTADEAQFLTALAREQNHSGCRGAAHDLLRKHVYPDAPLQGPGSLAFAYEAVPLTGFHLQQFTSLQEIDDFLRDGERISKPVWPWGSPEAYRARLEEARREWATRGVATIPRSNEKDDRQASQPSHRTGTGG